MEKQKSLVSEVYSLVKPFADQLNLTIWDITYGKEGKNLYLRVFIDKPNGVTIEDCEALSRLINKPLDNVQKLNQSYCLEVSSPGLERKLTRPEHFTAFLNSSVIIHTIRPDDNGKRDFKGILKNYDSKGNITISDENEEVMTFEKKQIAYVKLNDFEEE